MASLFKKNAKNLYLIERTSFGGYDTYNRAVVCAESASKARGVHPSGNQEEWKDYARNWVEKPSEVKATFIGTASSRVKLGEVLCASFNAG